MSGARLVTGGAPWKLWINEHLAGMLSQTSLPDLPLGGSTSVRKGETFKS
jgi:hypothetical protein